MAALPYMQLYVADYLADTMHLTTEEHGAYLLLIFNYWQTGKPIPVARLSRIARLTNERWTDVERTLSEFFNERDGEWLHERIERDLEALHATQAQRIAAGKASAEARKNAEKARPKATRNARSTTVEISLNENPTNKEEKRREENIQDQKPCAPSVSEQADLFLKFWALYPRKQDKAKAQKAWAKLKVNDELFTVIARGLGLQAVSVDWLKEGGKYIPMPTTWLNGKRWEDEVKSESNVHQLPIGRLTLTENRDYKAGTKENANGTFSI